MVDLIFHFFPHRTAVAFTSTALWARCSNRLTGRALLAARSYHHPPCEVQVGIPEFLNGVRKGVEDHVAKLEMRLREATRHPNTSPQETRGIPCKLRKLILKYTGRYRLGLWKPRADAWKLQSA
ncbi:uncharacterized protein [Typha angustifolia]|uniref:uncharacterized protein n=1 Tax=Typha angustifolia TaxID=59011 RepID=UPI003C2BC185